MLFELLLQQPREDQEIKDLPSVLIKDTRRAIILAESPPREAKRAEGNNILPLSQKKTCI